MSDSAGGLIGGAIGGTIGFFLGGPQGAATGFQIGYTAGNALFPPDLPGVEGPRLDDLQAQSAAYGVPIPIVYGRARIAGNIIWIQNNELIERRVVTETGGKGGGGGSQETVTYEYYASFACSICDGEITGIRRIWADSVLIYDAGDDVTPAGALGTLQISNQITAYTGTETQEPDALIEADVGAAPAFRGTAYVVFERLALKKYGNRIPNMTFEVVDGTAGITQIAQYSFDFEPQAQYPTGATQYPVLVDSSGRACFFRVGWTSGGTENATHYPTIIYPDGTVFEGTSFELARDYFGTVNPSLDESDKFTVARATASGGSATFFRVGEYDPINDTVSTTFFGTSNAVGIFNGDNHYCLKKNRITFYNQLSDDIAVSNYPGGSAANPLEMYLLLNSDAVTGTIFAHTHDGTTCYALTTSNILYLVNMDTREVSSSVTLNRTFSQLRYDDLWGKLYGLVTTTDIYEIDPATGDDTLVLDTNGGVEAFTVRGDLIQTTNNDVSALVATWYRTNAIGATDVNLSDIITDLCTRSGLAAGDIDVSGISDTVRGFVHTRIGPSRGDLRTLAASFHFDVVESGYTLKFVSRGGASAVTLTNDDLAAHEYGQSRPEDFSLMRERDIQIPYRVEVSFLDDDRDYDIGHQYAERLVTEAVSIEEVQLAILTTTADAAKIAEILLWNAWLERTQFEFSLPIKYSYLEPSDVVTLNLDEGTYTVRLTEVTFGSPGLLKCRGVQELSDIYSSSALGEEAQSYNQNVDLIGETRLKFLDIPILRDRDDDAGFYYAAGPTHGDWDGALLYQSNDAGENYFQIDAILGQASIGVTTDVLAVGETLVWDRASTVNVFVYAAGTLSSATESAVLNGSNLAAIGADGRWEIVKFANATLQSDGSYTLDTFIRGYQGTEWAMGLHQVGDCLVMLTDTTVQRHDPGADLIGSERQYKAVTFGNNILDASSQTFSNDAVGLKPLSPVHIKGSRNGAGDLTITWVRRTRIAGQWRDYVNVPLGEDSESYEIDILDAASPDTVLRTLTSSSETVSYTAAQQTTDFGSTQASVEVNIYQMSATVGRGFAGNAAI